DAALQQAMEWESREGIQQKLEMMSPATRERFMRGISPRALSRLLDVLPPDKMTELLDHVPDSTIDKMTEDELGWELAVSDALSTLPPRPLKKLLKNRTTEQLEKILNRLRSGERDQALANLKQTTAGAAFEHVIESQFHAALQGLSQEEIQKLIQAAGPALSN